MPNLDLTRLDRMIGKAVQECRKTKGFSQIAFCERMGSDHRTVKRLEEGDFSWQTLKNATAALGLKPSGIMAIAEQLEVYDRAYREGVTQVLDSVIGYEPSKAA